MSRVELFFDSDVTTPVTVHVHTHASTSSLSGLVQGPVTMNYSEARNFWSPSFSVSHVSDKHTKFASLNSW